MYRVFEESALRGSIVPNRMRVPSSIGCLGSDKRVLEDLRIFLKRDTNFKSLAPLAPAEMELSYKCCRSLTIDRSVTVYHWSMWFIYRSCIVSIFFTWPSIDSHNWVDFIYVTCICQLAPLKMWSNAALGFNHQSTCIPQRNEGSGKPCAVIEPYNILTPTSKTRTRLAGFEVRSI